MMGSIITQLEELVDWLADGEPYNSPLLIRATWPNPSHEPATGHPVDIVLSLIVASYLIIESCLIFVAYLVVADAADICPRRTPMMGPRNPTLHSKWVLSAFHTVQNLLSATA